MEMPDKATIQQEVDRNYVAFQKMVFPTHDKGKFAILRDGKVVEIMNNSADAHKMARRIFEDRIYSVQEIGADPVELGWYSYSGILH